MKMLPFLFALLLSLTSAQMLTAQPTQTVATKTTQQQTELLQKEISNDTKTVEILNDFKATKQQRKAIAKINKYVTPRILGRVRHREGLIGKVVKTQINFDVNGAITAITIIDGMGKKIDAKVIKLIKEYDQKQSIGQRVGNAPAIQLAIPLIGKKYFY